MIILFWTREGWAQYKNTLYAISPPQKKQKSEGNLVSAEVLQVHISSLKAKWNGPTIKVQLCSKFIRVWTNSCKQEQSKFVLNNGRSGKEGIDLKESITQYEGKVK